MPEWFCTRREAATTYRSYCLTQHAFHIQLTVPVELQDNEIILPHRLNTKGEQTLSFTEHPNKLREGSEW